MRFRMLRPRDVAHALRDLARRDPAEAEEYLDAHLDQWEALAEALPHDAADILEALPEDAAAELLADLETKDAADVLDEMAPSQAADLLEELEPERAAALIGEMSSAPAADVVSELEVDAGIVEQLDERTATEVGRLLAYAPDSAGGLMSTEVASLPIGLTAGEAIETVRRFSDIAVSSYVYVVDDHRRLVGVVSFRDLVFARPGRGLDEVMITNPVRVKTDTDREVLAELIARYNLLALPVTNEYDELVGVVTVGDALQAVQEEATEDIAAMVGAGAEETIFTPVSRSVRRRLPWIAVNLGLGLVLATIIGRFESTVERNAVLVAYLPLAALLGGNSGAQSLAVIIRAMAVGDIPRQRTRRVIRREFLVGLTNGLVMAVIAGTIGAVFGGELRIGVVVGIAVLVNMALAGFAGSGTPILLKKLGQDPALAANIFLTALTDIVGFGGFLLTARLLL